MGHSRTSQALTNCFLMLADAASLTLRPSAFPAQVLQNEQDLSTKRNSFQFLANHAEERAVGYLLSQIDNVALWGDILQMAVLDLIRKVGLQPHPAAGLQGQPRSPAALRRKP